MLTFPGYPKCTRIAEEQMARLFSVSRPFSAHLTKWEDDALPDKYDHNCFAYSAQPAKEEFQKALAYQKEKGADFIKLEGDEPLRDPFGLEESVTLTMTLRKDHRMWKRNDALMFRRPLLAEMEALEVKHYGPLYGEDFSRRNIRRLYEKLDYLGAYLDGRLVGACYAFRTEVHTQKTGVAEKAGADALKAGTDGVDVSNADLSGTEQQGDGTGEASVRVVCIDGLLVEEAYRHRYIATSLIAQIADAENVSETVNASNTSGDTIIPRGQKKPGAVFFLHADAEDTPRELYAKLGFEVTDRLYEYQSGKTKAYFKRL